MEVSECARRLGYHEVNQRIDIRSRREKQAEEPDVSQLLMRGADRMTGDLERSSGLRGYGHEDEISSED